MKRQSEFYPGTGEIESENPDALIELHQVVKTFKNAAGEFTVLKGINIGFRESQFVSVVGRSGSGKSTLLNMITGIDHPTSGVVRVGDVRLHTLNEGKMSIWRGRNMGIVFQFFQLLPMLTLLENVMLPMDFCDMYSPSEREARALALLKEVDLENLEHKYPAAVSGGQQQSAAVARALANDPPILIADEPTGNLDTRTAELILQIFEQQVERGKTVIMVTHDDVLAQRAARKIVISDGELVSEWIAKAFPEISHSDLLALQQAAVSEALAPEQNFEDRNDLIIVTGGRVDIIAGLKTGDLVVDVLVPGELFVQRFSNYDVTERKGFLAPLRRVSLRARGASKFALRAGKEGAKIFRIDSARLTEMLEKVPELGLAIDQFAQNRKNSHLISRN